MGRESEGAPVEILPSVGGEAAQRARYGARGHLLSHAPLRPSPEPGRCRPLALDQGSRVG